MEERKMAKKVTRKQVEEWLRKNRPHLATHENHMNGDKGWYRKDAGPAHSFEKQGKTWREVLAALTLD
jgi:hypothetical protein